MEERQTDNWGMVFFRFPKKLEEIQEGAGRQTFMSPTMKGNQMGVK